MEPIDSKLDLFQSLKDEDASEHEEPSSRVSVSEPDDLKFESRSDDDNNDNDNAEGESSDKGIKKKLDKQNRKEIEEEEREKML